MLEYVAASAFSAFSIQWNVAMYALVGKDGINKAIFVVVARHEHLPALQSKAIATVRRCYSETCYCQILLY